MLSLKPIKGAELGECKKEEKVKMVFLRIWW